MNKYLEEAKNMLKSIYSLADGQSDKKWVSNVDNNHWESGTTGIYTWDDWNE